jgi:WD40 repeat protein
VIRAWDFEQERVVRIYVNHSASITGLASLSHGKVAASCDISGKLHIWEPHSDQYAVYKVVPNFEYIKYQQYLAASPVKRKENASSQASLAVSVSEGGCTCLTRFGDEMVVMGTSEGLIPLFDVNAQRPVSMWQAGDCRDIVQSLSIQCIASKQTLWGEICAGFSNGRAATLDIRSGEVTSIGPLHEGPIKSLQYVGDHYIVSGGSDRKVRVWDRRKIASKIIAPLYSHSGFRDEISGLYPIGLRYVIATAGPRMKALDLNLDANQNQKPSKLRNESNTKESSSISGAAYMGLAGLVVFANEDGGFYVCE